MIPHKVNGTHIFIYNKIIQNAFKKKRENIINNLIFTIMEQSNSGMMGHGMPIESTKTNTNKKTKTTKMPDGTSYKKSGTDELFALVKDPKGEIHIAIGMNVVSARTFKKWEEAEKYIASKPYELLVNIMCLISKTYNNEKTTKNIEETEKGA